MAYTLFLFFNNPIAINEFLAVNPMDSFLFTFFRLSFTLSTDENGLFSTRSEVIGKDFLRINGVISYVKKKNETRKRTKLKFKH